LVLEKTECVPNIVVAGGPTVGLRMPSHWVCTALLNAFGGAIAATSANAHGQPSPTTASQVADTLGDSVSLIVEGGLTPTGLDSTVLGWVGGVPTVFRAGGVGRDNLERVLGRRLGESPS
jgi:L-threonylcarbamoyladenylate synthase